MVTPPWPEATLSNKTDEFPLVRAWSEALLADETVTGAVPPEFPEEFDRNLERRGSLAWDLMVAKRAAE